MWPEILCEEEEKTFYRMDDGGKYKHVFLANIISYDKECVNSYAKSFDYPLGYSRYEKSIQN